MGCYHDKQTGGKGVKGVCDFAHVISGECNGTSSTGKGTGYDGESATLESCNEACIKNSANWLYFGVQSGGKGCFCGETYGHQGKGNNCNEACRGNSVRPIPSFSTLTHAYNSVPGLLGARCSPYVRGLLIRVMRS